VLWTWSTGARCTSNENEGVRDLVRRSWIRRSWCPASGHAAVDGCARYDLARRWPEFRRRTQKQLPGHQTRREKHLQRAGEKANSTTGSRVWLWLRVNGATEGDGAADPSMPVLWLGAQEIKGGGGVLATQTSLGRRRWRPRGDAEGDRRRRLEVEDDGGAPSAARSVMVRVRGWGISA
jgi:hypothetical protein